MKRVLSSAEILIIVIIALIPVFATFPYRINIFLSWEGAYRLYQGQVPFKDFGMPVGYMYWVIPAMFFKIFGAQMITLIKAQAFINIVLGLSFRSIFKSLGVQPGIRFASVLVFVLSYTFFNYWPWYNNTVIMYELVGLAFLMRYIFGNSTSKWKYVPLVLSGFFIFCSFFTKQDGGALGFLIAVALMGYLALAEKKWLPLGIFVGSAVVSGLVLILPVSGTFGYWFNHGQPPHSSRMSMGDIIGDFLGGSQWLKFYILLVVVLLLVAIKSWKEFWLNRQQMIFTLLTLGILAQAAIFQVTSYVPVDNNIFFHSFAFVFIISMLSLFLPINFNSWKPVIVLAAAVMLWWSHIYFRYIQRFILKGGGEPVATMTYNGHTYATEVNRNTYMIYEENPEDIPLEQWRVPKLKSFERVMMPNPTADGVERIMNMDLVKKQKNLKVLNMSELTPLAAEIPYELERGSEYPLWFHKGVGMFSKETDMFVNRIKNKHYDLVLFEYIPYLNNFYPFEVRAALEANYKKVDSFTAPRKPSSSAWVEVYVKP